MNRKPFFVAIALALLATGCATTAAPPAGLAGTSWRIVTIDGTRAAEGSMLAFTANSLSASAGCNRLGGAYSVVGGKLTAGPLAATRM
jgi:heat shock protein HslJ